MKAQHKYQFYASLLDAFQSYLDSAQTWNKFWGNSDDPKKTEEEYEKECFQSLIDKINRVPVKWEDSEKMDAGTSFNEIVDCIISGKKSDKMEIEKIPSLDDDSIITDLRAKYNDRIFIFPLPICLSFSRYFKGAISQVYCEGTLPTKYGDVLLYGYIDELMADKVHDIKTTGSYEAWKYRKNWQHRVYPYCLAQAGNTISGFEYNILEIKSGRYDIHTEFYDFNYERAQGELIAVCEQFVEFLEANRKSITDEKIFNNLTNNTL